MSTANAATNVKRPVSVTFGQKFSRLLSRLELRSLLLSELRAVSAKNRPTPLSRQGLSSFDCESPRGEGVQPESHVAAESPPYEGGFRWVREVDLIVLHCSDTRPSQDFTIEKLAASHKARGFGDYPGYHFYIRRDGTLYYCRPLSLKGCHVKGYNANSIGICTEGGHRDDPPQIPVGDLADLAKLENGAASSPPTRGIKGVYEDNRTAEQKVVLHDLLLILHEMFPEAKICGHRDLPGVAKACPCYDAAKEYAYIIDN